MFAQMMIPRHKQAVEMGEMLLAKEGIPAQVVEFAQGLLTPRDRRLTG
ncbi:putative secreted protein [Corynebacterium amycolatum]|nr:putative secreted protein [Corynebacterium amycolatum]